MTPTPQSPFALLAASALAFGAAIGCQPENKFVPPPPPQVTVAKPVEREVADALEFTGWTEATATVDLRARVTGYLEKVNFEDGQRVEQGDLLFVIEQAPFEASLASAQAEVAKAEAGRQLAQSEYDRAVPLVQRSAMTQAELDIEAAELATAKASLASMKAALRQADLNLAYTEIRAPIGGIIGRRLVDPGNLVAAGETQLAKIEQIEPIYAYFSVSESDLLRAMEVAKERGQSFDDWKGDPPPLYLGLANEVGYPRKGHFDFSERTLDRQTGTAMRRGLFENSKQDMIPGMFVHVRAPLGEPKPRLMVEERAVSADQRGEYLLVVNDKKIVEHRPVRLGPAREGMRVVFEGVAAEDWVIVNGLQRARPGAPVDPQPEGATPAETTAGGATAGSSSSAAREQRSTAGQPSSGTRAAADDRSAKPPAEAKTADASVAPAKAG